MTQIVGNRAMASLPSINNNNNFKNQLLLFYAEISSNVEKHMGMVSFDIRGDSE